MRARSEGGSVSHISSIFENRQVIEIIDDNEVIRVPAATPVRSSARLTSRNSLFVTPGPHEPRYTATPSSRWRSTSALQARRASSAPHVDASLPPMSSSPCIDLTGLEDSDEEAEDEDVDQGGREDRKEEGGTVQPKDDTMSAANQVADEISAQFNPGNKRARLTSPASEGGRDIKRQKPDEHRSLSLPLRWAQDWSFPDA